MERGGYVYIMTNSFRSVLYTGVTSNLFNRVHEHKSKRFPNSFTSRNNITILVYHEGFSVIEEAIEKEKQIKAGSRKKKIEMINKLNPQWKDLSPEIEHLS